MWKPPEPAKTYELLERQFRALCSLTSSFEAQLRFYQKQTHDERLARSQIEGERAANQVLTDEIERLNNIIEKMKRTTNVE